MKSRDDFDDMFVTEQIKKIVPKGDRMDRRSKKTRESILQSFGSLLEKRSYDRITVQEIIDDADVGRATFYAHFPSKDDLLKTTCVDLFDHVFPTPSKQEKEDIFKDSHAEKDEITHIFFHLKKNKYNLLTALLRDGNTLFLCYFREYVDRYIAANLLKQKQHSGTIPESFLYRHISTTFMDLVQWWIDDGAKREPEEMAEIFFTVIHPVL